MWLPDDLGWVQAWQQELDMQCPGCGRPTDEAWHPEAEGTYEVPVTRCHSCTERARKAQSWEEQGGDKAGVFFGVRATDDTPRGGRA